MRRAGRAGRRAGSPVLPVVVERIRRRPADPRQRPERLERRRRRRRGCRRLCGAGGGAPLECGEGRRRQAGDSGSAAARPMFRRRWTASGSRRVLRAAALRRLRAHCNPNAAYAAH